MRTKLLQLSLFLLVGSITACASSPNSPTASSSSSKDQQIIGDIPPGSPFSKIKIGMPTNQPTKQVHDLIGEPTDTANHTTGKMFIPFYFGNDIMRSEDLYKGQGRIVYTGAGIGGVNFHVYQIIYDASEDGYNNN